MNGISRGLVFVWVVVFMPVFILAYSVGYVYETIKEMRN